MSELTPMEEAAAVMALPEVRDALRSIYPDLSKVVDTRVFITDNPAVREFVGTILIEDWLEPNVRTIESVERQCDGFILRFKVIRSHNEAKFLQAFLDDLPDEITLDDDDFNALNNPPTC